MCSLIPHVRDTWGRRFLPHIRQHLNAVMTYLHFFTDMPAILELDHEPCCSCAFHLQGQLGRIIYLNPTYNRRSQLLATENHSAPNIQSSTFPGNTVIWNAPWQADIGLQKVQYIIRHILTGSHFWRFILTLFK